MNYVTNQHPNVKQAFVWKYKVYTAIWISWQKDQVVFGSHAWRRTNVNMLYLWQFCKRMTLGAFLYSLIQKILLGVVKRIKWASCIRIYSATNLFVNRMSLAAFWLCHPFVSWTTRRIHLNIHKYIFLSMYISCIFITTKSRPKVQFYNTYVFASNKSNRLTLKYFKKY